MNSQPSPTPEELQSLEKLQENQKKSLAARSSVPLDSLWKSSLAPSELYDENASLGIASNIALLETQSHHLTQLVPSLRSDLLSFIKTCKILDLTFVHCWVRAHSKSQVSLEVSFPFGARYLTAQPQIVHSFDLSVCQLYIQLPSSASGAGGPYSNLIFRKLFDMPPIANSVINDGVLLLTQLLARLSHFWIQSRPAEFLLTSKGEDLKVFDALRSPSRQWPQSYMLHIITMLKDNGPFTSLFKDFYPIPVWAKCYKTLFTINFVLAGFGELRSSTLSGTQC